MTRNTMAAIAANGIGPTTCLRIWGEVRNREKGHLLPDGWGWPSSSVEWRLMRLGHGAIEPGRQPELTAPEQAVANLESERAIAHWTAAMLTECKDRPRIAAHLYYVVGKCWEDIAKQMNETEPTEVEDVERMLHSVKVRIRRALDLLSMKAA